MQKKESFAIQALIVILLFNTALVVLLYLLGGEAMEDEAAIVFGIGLLVTLLLWVVLKQLIRKHLEAAAAPAPEPKPASRPEPQPEARPAPPALPPTTAAVQLLSLLQRNGRFVDFLQEDLGPYDDAQIGAAVRSVHEGCRQVLTDHVVLEPIFDEPEGSPITIAPGFDAQTVRLTGNVEGNPPFHGVLRHRGWRVKNVDLPAIMPGQAPATVVAAAEVEVGG